MKTALVCGAGGFIGSHLVTRLKSEGYWVRGVDLKHPEFSKSNADDFMIGDLRDKYYCLYSLTLDDCCFDEVYQLAADMGGAGFVNTGEHDSDIMYNSVMINLNILNLYKKYKKIFYSSSACVYSRSNCSEENVYPANPDSEYGWEKLFSERLYFSYHRNYNVDVRVARFHNIFGIKGTYKGGREKAPAAICYKVNKCSNNGSIEIWGDGKQKRSFLYIDDCIDGIRKLMNSDFNGAINIGSEEIITINDLAKMIIDISEKKININNITGPIGVNERNSDNTLIQQILKWKPESKLIDGIIKTYNWIKQQEDQN